MISFEISEEQELIRETLREFANEEMRSIGRDCDEAFEIPQTFLDSVWELGLTATQIEGLRVISSGPEIADATLILRSLKMELLIKELKSRVDLVVLDSPPLLSVTDPMLIAPLVDGVLLVVDARRTKRDALKRAVEILQQALPAVAGTVLINVTAKNMGYYYDYYPYYSQNGTEASTKRRGLIPKVLRIRNRR